MPNPSAGNSFISIEIMLNRIHELLRILLLKQHFPQKAMFYDLEVDAQQLWLAGNHEQLESKADDSWLKLSKQQ